MEGEIKIPFGYKQVPPGMRCQWRDGKWDGEKFVRVKKLGRGWPLVADEVVIRRCTVEQPELPGT